MNMSEIPFVLFMSEGNGSPEELPSFMVTIDKTEFVVRHHIRPIKKVFAEQGHERLTDEQASNIGYFRYIVSSCGSTMINGIELHPTRQSACEQRPLGPSPNIVVSVYFSPNGYYGKGHIVTSSLNQQALVSIGFAVGHHAVEAAAHSFWKEARRLHGLVEAANKANSNPLTEE